jgi:hypothetical protein
MIPPKIMPVMGLMAPLRSGPLRPRAQSIQVRQFHSRNPHSLEINLTYCTCYVTVRSRLTCFGTLDVIFKSTSASADRPLHENRIINTIRFQPEEVLAFGCDVSCLSERQSRPALGGWPLLRATRGTAAGMMKPDCRRKIAPALSLAPGLLRRRNIEQQIVSKNLFFPVLFEMGLDRLFSVSSAVNYVAPS